MLRTMIIGGLVCAGLAAALPAQAVAETPLEIRCQAALSFLGNTIVRKEAVRAVGANAAVHVMPFCMGVQIDDFGNAAGLGRTIGANPVLAQALARSGFRSDDVTDITISGNSVTLYVHRD